MYSFATTKKSGTVTSAAKTNRAYSFTTKKKLTPAAQIYANQNTSANANESEQNKGGFIGGLGYFFEKIGAGFMQGIEGIVDYTVGGVAELFGADEFAEDVFESDWMNYNHADDWYNPSEGWKVAGDIAGGIGSSLPGITAGVAVTLASGGTMAATGVGLMTSGLAAAGTSTKEAFMESGELGGKEFGYGAMMGAVEAGTEALSGALGAGLGKSIKAVGTAFGKTAGRVAGKTVGKTVGKTAVKAASKGVQSLTLKSVAKQAGKEFLSEAFEEGFAEIVSPYAKRLTYDPNAKSATVEEVLYAATIGGISGVLMGGARGGFTQAVNNVRGNSIVKQGGEAEVMALAKQMIDDDAGGEYTPAIKQIYERLSPAITSGAELTGEQRRELGELKTYETANIMQGAAARSAIAAVNGADAIAARLNADGRYKIVDGKFTFVEDASTIKKGAAVREITAEDITSGYDANDKSSIYKALKNNDVLRYVASADAAGRFIMSAKEVENAALAGNKIRTQADLNKFIETASEEQKAAVGRELGITDWNTLNIDGLNEKISAYRESGKAEAYKQKIAKIDEIKAKAESKARSIPKAIAISDGAIQRYADTDSNIAVARTGDSFIIYDYTSGNVSKDMTRAEVNAALARYRQATEANAAPAAQMPNAVVQNAQTSSMGAVGARVGTSEAAAEVKSENASTNENLSSEAKNSQNGTDIEINDEKISKSEAEAKEFDALATKKVKGYDKLSAADKSMIRKIFREARAMGISEADALSYARVAARTGLDVQFSKQECYKGKNEAGEDVYHAGFYDPENNRIVVNPETNKKHTVLLIHELSHAMRSYLTKGGEYKYFIDKDAKVSKELWDEIKKYYADENGKLDAELALDEASAYYAEALFGTEGAIDLLLGEKPTLKQKILSFFAKSSEYYSTDEKLSREARRHFKKFKAMFDAFAARNQARSAEGANTNKAAAPVAEKATEKANSSESKPKRAPKADVARRGVVRLVTNARREALRGAAVKNGKQYISDGNFAARYTDVIDGITEVSAEGYPFDVFDKSIKGVENTNESERIEIDADKIRQLVPAKKSDYPKTIAKIGDNYYQLHYVSKILDSLANPKVYVQPGALKSLYFKGDNGEAILLPLNFSKSNAPSVAYEADYKAKQSGKSARRYSFAGPNAKTANLMKLSTAERMLSEGVDSETVRKETGWFRGYDGKWRFEIDDLDSALIEKPNLTKHVEDGDVYFTGKLSDILDHKALFAAYPKLKNINIVIQKTEFGVDAIYQPKSNYITLSIEQFKRRTNAYLDYLNGGRKAEIEKIEATPEYKAYNRLYDDEITDSMEPEAWLKAESEARDKFFSSELGKRYYQLMWGKNGFAGETFELGWGDAAKEVLIHELQHAIQNEEGFATGTNTRDVNYDRNAGEIEARDAAKRANLTEEERKNTRPNIDRTDVVLKGGTVSYFAKNEKNDEVNSIREQLVNHLDEINAISPVANINYEYKDKETAKKDAFKLYKTKGLSVDRQNFGVIELSEKEIKESSNYVNTPAEAAAWMTIPNVLKRGKFISGHSDHKSEGFPTYTIAAPVVINGKPGVVGAVVKQTGKYRYKAHRIIMPDGNVFLFEENKNAEPTGSDILIENNEKGPDISSASNPIIPDSEQKSNPSDENFSKNSRRASAELDNSYMSAVKRGDMVTAQRMVDEAAKEAGVLIDSETNQPLHLYHGGNADITVFDGKKGINGKLANRSITYFSPYREVANNYKGKGSNRAIYDCYLVLNNPLVITSNDYTKVASLNDDKVHELELQGYDGVIFYPDERSLASGWMTRDNTEYVAFKSAQIKSADPVTYDANGNVIPLSERFNPKKRDIRYSSETIENVAKSRFTEPDAKFSEKIKAKFTSVKDKLYIDAVDEMWGIEKYLKEKGGVKDYAAVVQQVRASETIAQTMIGVAQYDITESGKGKRLGDGITKIFKKYRVRKIEADFNDYLLHQLNVDRMTLRERSLEWQDELLAAYSKAQADFNRAEALVKQGKAKHIPRGIRKALTAAKKAYESFEVLENKPVFGANEKRATDITADESRKIIEEYEKEHPEFKKSAEEIWAYLRNLQEMRVKGGLISQESADVMAKYYPHYVPSFRDTTKAGGAGVVKNESQLAVKSTIKSAKGGSEDVYDIDESIAVQTMQTVKAIKMNQLARAVYDAAEKSGDTTYVLTREAAEQRANADPDDDVTPDLTPKNNQIVFFLDGKKVEMNVSEEIFAGFKGVNDGSVPKSILWKAASKVLGGFKNLVTQYSPTFAVRNFIRDMQDAYINTKHPKRFLKNIPAALKDMVNNGAEWQLYLAYGGFASTVFDAKGFTNGVGNRGFEAFRQISGIDENDFKKMGKALKNVLTAVGNANAFIEQLTRFTEFKASLAAGDSVEVAINNSAEVTTNFSRHGKTVKVLNATVIPFLNASVQGFDKLLRVLAGPYRERSLAALGILLVKIFAIGIAPQILNMIMNGDDEDYENLTNEVKENYFLIKAGDEFIKIPRGRAAGAFGGIANRLRNVSRGEDFEFLDYLESLERNVTPIDSISRDIFSPFRDVASNTTWYGGEIEGRQFEGVRPGQRFDESTSEIAKWIGEKINYSPKKIHYLIDQYSGVIGDILLPATTAKAEKGYLASNFLLDPATNNKLSNEFYELYDEAQYSKNEGNVTALYQLKHLNDVKSSVSELYDEITKIQQSDKSNSEKLQEVRTIRILINNLYKTAKTDYAAYTKAIEATDGVFDDTDAGEQRIRHAVITQKMYGSEKALKEYNTDVYAKSQLFKKAGVSYDSYYQYYFATKGIQSDLDKDGEVIAGSKRKKVIKAITDLELSRQETLLLIAASGYKINDGDVRGVSASAAKNMLLRYILGMNATKAEKEELAKACGFKVKNGKILKD